MVFLISQVNNCTYTLDAEHYEDLMYAPLLSDGSYETARSAYSFVDWDSISEKVAVEAARCHRLLLAEVN